MKRRDRWRDDDDGGGEGWMKTDQQMLNEDKSGREAGTHARLSIAVKTLTDIIQYLP